MDRAVIQAWRVEGATLEVQGHQGLQIRNNHTN
jgi:hypothetical protein